MNAAAAPPPSYYRDVAPLLQTACIGCHSAPTPAGGLTLDSYSALMKGGASGAVVVPGKGGASRLVLMLTGAVKPQMPPGAGLKTSDIGAVRRWVDAGAKDDTPAAPLSHGTREVPAGTGISRMSAAAPRALGTLRRVPTPALALTFSPDGKTLAVGAYQRVLFCDPATRQVTGIWEGHADAVRALAYSPDGRTLAAGGGTSGARGEVRMWNVAESREARAFGNQADAVNAVAFSPDGKTLATGSADKTIQLWDPLTAKPLQTLRDHADAVLGLTFRADGKFLASCSADRSVKAWDTATWRRVYTLGAHDEPVTSAVFAPGAGPLLTTSTDRTAKVWNFGAESSALARTLGGHGHSVFSVAISPDGQFAATASADKTVRLWNIASGAGIATLNDAKDWVYVVRFAPDGKRLAAGTWDGTVYLWNIETHKLEGVISTLRPASER